LQYFSKTIAVSAAFVSTLAIFSY